MRLIKLIVLSALLVSGCGWANSGQPSDQIRLCADRSHSTQGAVAACTALIDGGQLDDANLEFVYFNRAQGLDLLGDYDQAIRDFDHVIRLQPKNAMAFGFRGALHGKKGELDAAIVDIDRALVLNPKDGEAHMNRGTALESKGAYAEALRSYNRAIELMPESSIALGGRCWVRAAMEEDLELALSDCTKAIALDARDPNFYNSRGFAYFRLGLYDKSIRDYDAAIAGNPKVASSFYIRGLAKRAAGDSSEGDADVAAGRSLDPRVAARYQGFGIATE